MTMQFNLEQELRIMHACELGAVGVYRGHKCAARYFFRRHLSSFDSMRYHEKNHAELFKTMLDARQWRACYGYPLFFWAGLLYGVGIGLLGLKAIGKSTSTIEKIVDVEFNIFLGKIEASSGMYNEIKLIQIEEQTHQRFGEEMASAKSDLLGAFVESIARWGAYTAKYLAKKL